MKKLLRFPYFHSVLVLLLIIFLWQLYSQSYPGNAIFLPSPSSITNSILNNWDTLALHTWQTVLETVFGLIIAVIIAIIISVFFSLSPLTRKIFFPYIIVSQTFPLIALAPLLLIWFGFGITPKIIMVFLFCFFPIVISTTYALSQVDQNMINLLLSMNANKWQILRLVRIPSALPAFFSGLRVAATYAMTGAIAGEFVASEKGLGLFMKTSANSHAFSLVYACILVIIVISILLFILVNLLEKKFVPWNFH